MYQLLSAKMKKTNIKNKRTSEFDAGTVKENLARHPVHVFYAHVLFQVKNVLKKRFY